MPFRSGQFSGRPSGKGSSEDFPQGAKSNLTSPGSSGPPGRDEFRFVNRQQNSETGNDSKMKGSSEVSLSDLCRVSRGTPAGEWFRRYWLAVGTTREPPRHTQGHKILAQDLVLFRDREG